VHDRLTQSPFRRRAAAAGAVLTSLWARYSGLLVIATAVALAAGSAFGPSWGWTCAALILALALVHQVRHLSAMIHWLRDPSLESMPSGAGAWEDVYAGLYRMLRRQRHSASQLSATLEDFRRAWAAMPDGVVILDVNDHIEWCNPKAEQHFGLELSRDQGQSITYLVRQPQFSEHLHAAHYEQPLALRHARTGDRVLSVQLVPYGDRQKLLISRDVTELQRVETMRRDFIANVSHELRTPLTVLCGFLETLTDAQSAQREPLLERSLPLMLTQAQRMERLVADLLTLSRLESDSNPTQEQRVDMPALVRSLYQDAVAYSAGRHRIALGTVASAAVLGAEDELRSAFGNLISNAVRYTPDGGTITLSWTLRGGEPRFAVRDTGIGIEAAHIARLTERFYRVDRGRSRETGGTGLGLAIVKHVLQRHDATLEVDSTPGQGSTFTAVFAHRRVAREKIGEVQAPTGA
jgi:two-component system, OmpR family, phosphate regulon sensor histidine kinase PhoR